MRYTTKRRSLVVRLLFLALLVGLVSCGGRGCCSKAKKTGFRAASSKAAVGFRLSNADEHANEVEPKQAVVTTKLSEAEVAAALGKVAPLKEEPTEDAKLALRDKSIPPPRTGRVLADTFPPPLSSAPPPSLPEGSLKVLRRSPEGEVPLAPFLSVTFSHPMVALTSLDDLAKVPVPVSVLPKPEGKWRWIGTQTAVFQPLKRFPMASAYEVEVPAGTKAATGQTLDQAERWRFSTPPVSLLANYPSSSPQDLDRVLLLKLDQKVDPQAVLPFVHVTADNEPVAVNLAATTLFEDPGARAFWKETEEGRRLALQPVKPLPKNSAIRVELGSGAPSAEGPRRTEKTQPFTFRTYAPLTVESRFCTQKAPCVPLTGWTFYFNNSLDRELFDPSSVKVEPDLPDLKASVNGQTLSVQGRSRGRTVYRVTLKSSLTDVYNQKLTTDQHFSIHVGSAEPALFSRRERLTVLDPAGPPSYAVYSVNEPSLRVRLLAVGPEHFGPWIRYFNSSEEDDKQGPPGQLLFDNQVPIKGEPDEIAETRIDLHPALKQGSGQVILLAEPTQQPKETWKRMRVRAWVQVTALGLEAFQDPEGVLGWVNSLRDGKPVQGAELSFFGSSQTAATDAQGLATLPYAEDSLLIAKKGPDLALLPTRGAQPKYQQASSSVGWFVYDDRKIYKPGETVRVKGWVRRIGMRKGGDVDGIPGIESTQLSWVAQGGRFEEIAKGTATPDRSGGFDFSFEIPSGANLGIGHVRLSLSKGESASVDDYRHDFQLEEFRRPEFEVTASTSEGPHLVGQHAIATVSAKYYAGGGLGNATVDWLVTQSSTSFRPPNHPDYSFGASNQWFWRPRLASTDASQSETWSAQTDGQGNHRLRIDIDPLAPPFPRTLQLSARVTDVNRQGWGASALLTVHPAEVYVGLQTPRGFVREGDTLPVDILTTDIEGKILDSRKVEVVCARTDWVYEKGEHKTKSVDEQTCEVVTGQTPKTCKFAVKKAGTYTLSAIVSDDKGRQNQTDLRVWVAGGQGLPDRDLETEQVKLVPDKKEYAVGDTAELLLLAPFAPAEGILNLERLGRVKTERFTLQERSHVLKIKIEESYYPSITAKVFLAGSAPRAPAEGEVNPNRTPRPAQAIGAATLAVPPRARTLTVAVKPKHKSLPPKGETTIDVQVNDAAGAPVPGATVAVSAVDEAILALTGYQIQDPVQRFYPKRPDQVEGEHLRSLVQLAGQELVGGSDGLGKSGPTRSGAISGPKGNASSSTGTGQGFGSGHGRLGALPGAPAPPAAAAPAPLEGLGVRASAEKSLAAGEQERIAVRSDFSPLALWSPVLTTDSAGRLSVPLKLPDNLTRYRITAVAVSGEKHFGLGEATLTARLPLLVRPSPPRFLNYGDRFELPVVVQNQTELPLSVDLVARASNASLTEGAGRRFRLGPSDRAEVRFPAAAALPGKARFQIVATAGGFADAAEVALPTWTPATTEAFATQGALEEGALSQPVQPPSNAVKNWGGLEVSVSSTNLQALTDAMVYLYSYPFECNEQISSRLMGIAALKDVLNAFQVTGLPSQEEMIAAVAEDVRRLQRRQHPSGGWDYWRQDHDPSPYVSIHVMHALQRAKDKGFDVPAPMLSQGQHYLRTIENHLPAWYGVETRRTLVAYALYVRNRFGERDSARARSLLKESGGVKTAGLEMLGWLLPVLTADPQTRRESDEIRTVLGNRVTETAGAAHFVTSYQDSNAYVLLSSDRRVDGILLEGLIGVDPKNTLIPKLVAGLLGHRKAGRWSNTQENVWVLLALDKYFNTYEKTTPNFVARAWLGEFNAGEHRFQGRSTDRYQVAVPMARVAEIGNQSLVLQKEGEGRLYYRFAMQYAPADLRLPPVEQGFSVARTYESVDRAEDVTKDDKGVWHVKAGARVRARVTLVAPARRYHVALIDPVPAGLEPLNPALKVTEAIPGDANGPAGKSGFWYNRAWYEHQNLRDERVEAFASLLWAGEYEYSYVARATTPGEFVVPPPKVEEMYAPETFGRGAGDRMIIR